MPGFAERMGHRPVRATLQVDALDRDTRLALWNLLVVIREVLQRKRSDHYSNVGAAIESALWTEDLKGAADEQPWADDIWRKVKELVLDGHWIDALDVIENITRYLKQLGDPYTTDLAAEVPGAFNERFATYLVGVRFVDGILARVSSTTEAAAIETALEDLADDLGARHHLERAIDLLSDRQNPDYPNSVKESISAVEAVVKKTTGVGTLGSALKKLDDAGVRIHPALKTAWEKMYGWTSAADGIRHGGIEPATADQAVAKYMVVASSAFVSYLIEARSRISD